MTEEFVIANESGKAGRARNLLIYNCFHFKSPSPPGAEQWAPSLTFTK
jgi:hypothetical protein